MNKFFSRKFLTLVGLWMFNIGGLVSGELETSVALTNLGVSGGVYILVQGILDMVSTNKGQPHA